MRTASLVSILIAACLLMQTVAAQTSARRLRSAASKALHKAWLSEKLDLNSAAAAGTYDETIKNSTSNMPERWIAVARLEELGRLGVLQPEPRSRPSQVPPAVRKALKRLDTPIPFRDVLDNPDRETDLPPLRPATPRVQDWAREHLEPVFQERIRQERRRRQRQRTTSPEGLRRWQSLDVLRRELQGKRPQARQLRSFYFPTRKPPVVTGKPEDVLKEAEQRLVDWIAAETVSWHRTTLRELQKGLKVEAESGARNAIRFLQRLPYYSEKLLGPEEPKSAVPDEGK